jgi:S1-C subfamily serine protease
MDSLLFIFALLLQSTEPPTLAAPATLPSHIDATSMPTSSPTADDSSAVPQAWVKQWLTQLANRDPIQREAAMEQLMGLKKAELPQLKAAIRDAGSDLSPTQQLAIHDVVIQVFLAAETYPLDPGESGFLGVSLRSFKEDKINKAPVAGKDAGLGVMIYNRLPGFVANRRLRDGDVVVGISESRIPITDTNAFQHAIVDFHAGQMIHLQIQRSGRRIVVPIVLDHRPLISKTSTDPTDPFEDLLKDRYQSGLDAETFWDTEFAPLFPQPAAAEATD